MEESVLGYPHHWFRAVGHMAEASSELVNEYPDLAMEIREHRKVLMDDLEYAIPFTKLLQECYERKNLLGQEVHGDSNT